MQENQAGMSKGDERLFSSLLGEISCIQELLNVLEEETVSVDEAVDLVGGIQRDIVQLYQAAR